MCFQRVMIYSIPCSPECLFDWIEFTEMAQGLFYMYPFVNVMFLILAC